MAIDKTKEYQKEYRKNNSNKMKEYQKEYRKNNSNKMKGYQKEYRKNNKEKKSILDREYRKKNKNSFKYKQIKKHNSRKYAQRHPEIIKAHYYAYRFIPLKSACEICGEKKNLQRHHWNYNKPLLVNTLCGYCHQVQHIKNSGEN